MSDIIVGLDIGYCYIRCVIGQVEKDDKLTIIAAAKKETKGCVKNGAIININGTANIIKEVIEESELMAGIDIDVNVPIFASVGGSHVKGVASAGNIAVDPSAKKNRRLEITEEDKDRAIAAASTLNFPMEISKLHIVPQDYIVDGQSGFKSPVGISAVRLDVSVFIITANVTVCRNILSCVKRIGFPSVVSMSKTLVASVATLQDEEMELGSIIIDLGAETTDVIVIHKGAPVYISSIQIGGEFVTNDIVQVKGIPYADAEEIKIKYGCCWLEGNEIEEEVIIREIGARPIEQTTRYDLCQIIQPRVAEIMEWVKRDIIRHSGLKSLDGSIVLTGGGALMPGIVPLTQSIWRTTSVRIGECADFGLIPGEGIDPKCYRKADFATAVGLVLANVRTKRNAVERKKKSKSSDDENSKSSVIGKFVETLKNFF